MLTYAYSMQQGEILFAKTGCCMLLVDVESFGSFTSALIHISVISKAVACVFFFVPLSFCECYFGLPFGQFGMYLSLSRGIGVNVLANV